MFDNPNLMMNLLHVWMVYLIVYGYTHEIWLKSRTTFISLIGVEIVATVYTFWGRDYAILVTILLTASLYLRSMTQSHYRRKTDKGII